MMYKNLLIKFKVYNWYLKNIVEEKNVIDIK